MAPFVLVLMWIMAPVAWPTAKLLDWLLGADHGTTYKKAGLKTLVTLHKTLGTTPDERLNQDEVTIISAVLDLKEKPVGSIMTPMGDVFTMSADTVLDQEMVNSILVAGYSRIPIYAPGDPRNFVGMLLVKMLITYDPEDALKVHDFALATLPETRPETSCLDIMNFFQEGKSHMVLISDFPGEPYGALGVLTLEDVIEELIGEEIIDESDVFVDVHKAIRRMAPAPKNRVPKGQVVEPESSQAVATEDLIDLDTDKPVPSTEAANGDVNDGTSQQQKRASMSEMSSSPRATKFLMRRISAANGSNETVPVRSNDPEIMAHLKGRLGPANTAARPKTTRYNTVKIKPGMSNVPENAATRSGTQPEPKSRAQSDAQQPHSTPKGPKGGEGEGLVHSAGKGASDGVLAVAAGYGTMTSPTRPHMKDQASPPDSSTQYQSIGTTVEDEDNEATPRPLTRRADPSAHSTAVSGKMIVGQADVDNEKSDNEENSDRDSIGSMQKPVSRNRHNSGHPRRTGTRSGSITEQLIESGGVKKIVLGTTSSSDTEDNNNSQNQSDAAADQQEKNSDSNASGRETPSGQQSHSGQGSEQGKREGNKKNRKRRKRKGNNKKDGNGDRNGGDGENDENAPLLAGKR